MLLQIWNFSSLWEFRDEQWHWNMNSLRWRLVSWFPAVSSPIWPHALGFISGFPGGYLPLLWTLHHWVGWNFRISPMISPLAYLLSTIAYLALSLVWIVKRYSLSCHCVLFELLLMVGVSWRSVDSGSHCPKDEKNPRVGFMEKKICECAGGCGDLEEMEAAFGAGVAAWSSSQSLLNAFPQHYLWSGVYANRSLLGCK